MAMTIFTTIIFLNTIVVFFLMMFDALLNTRTPYWELPMKVQNV